MPKVKSNGLKLNNKKWKKYFLLLVFLIILTFYFISLVPDSFSIPNEFNSSSNYPDEGLSNKIKKIISIEGRKNRSRERGNLFKEIHHSKCNCKRKIIFKRKQKKVTKEKSFERNFTTTCGIDADQRGPGQNIISFSLFDLSGSGHLKYIRRGITENIKGLRLSYYDDDDIWTIRIYSDLKLDAQFCNLICKNSQIDWCDIKRDFPKIISKNMINQRTWRFLPLGDPFVKKFVSRDLDSVITKRERMAVLEWENSDKAIHIMRDHPKHLAPILAGMWGMNLEKFGYNLSFLLLKDIIKASNYPGKSVDQTILKNIIYLSYKDKGLIMEHDSFNCEIYKNSIPFPTRREYNQNYVGSPILRIRTKIDMQCPIVCRPEKAKDWIFC